MKAKRVAHKASASSRAGMGKDLGKIAGSLKAEAATFSEAMNESLAEAEKVRGRAGRLPVELSLSALSSSLCLPQPSCPGFCPPSSLSPSPLSFRLWPVVSRVISCVSNAFGAMVVGNGSGVETVDLVSLRRLFVPVVWMRVCVCHLCVDVASLVLWSLCLLSGSVRRACLLACAVRKCDMRVVCVWSRLGLCLVSCSRRGLCAPHRLCLVLARPCLSPNESWLRESCLRRPLMPPALFYCGTR